MPPQTASERGLAGGRSTVNRSRPTSTGSSRAALTRRDSNPHATASSSTLRRTTSGSTATANPRTAAPPARAGGRSGPAEIIEIDSSSEEEEDEVLPEPIVARKSQNKKKQRRVDSSEEDELDDESDAAEVEEDRSKRRKSDEGVPRPGHAKPRAIATTTRKVASRPDPSLPSTPPSSGDGQGVSQLNANRARIIGGRRTASAARLFVDDSEEEEEEEKPSEDDEVEAVRPPLAAGKRASASTRASENGKTSQRTSKNTSTSASASAPSRSAASREAPPTSSRPSSRQARATQPLPSILRKSSRIVDSDDDVASVASVRSTRSRTKVPDAANKKKKGKSRATSEEDEDDSIIPVEVVKKRSKTTGRARERGFEGTALMDRRDSLLLEEDFLPPDQPLVNRPAAAAIALEKAAEAVLVSSPAPSPTSVIKLVVKPYDIEAELECAVCYEVMVAPVNLHCGHVFCQACVEPWLDQNDNECPNCREKSGKPFRSYPIDAIIKKHLEVVYTALAEQGQVEAARTARAERAKVEAAAVQKRIDDARQKEMRVAQEAARVAMAQAQQRAHAMRQGFAYPGVPPQHRAQVVRRAAPAPAPLPAPAAQHLRAADLQRMARDTGLRVDQILQMMAEQEA